MGTPSKGLADRSLRMYGLFGGISGGLDQGVHLLWSPLILDSHDMGM